MKGFRLRNIVALFLLVLMGASVLMAHVWKQNAYVRLSKESVKLGREGKALRDSIALLEMEAGDLRKLGRIELLARDPRPPASRPLRGRPGYRVRIGDWRVLYTIDDGVLLVVVLRLGHRKDVYDA